MGGFRDAARLLVIGSMYMRMCIRNGICKQAISRSRCALCTYIHQVCSSRKSESHASFYVHTAGSHAVPHLDSNSWSGVEHEVHLSPHRNAAPRVNAALHHVLPFLADVCTMVEYDSDTHTCIVAVTSCTLPTHPSTYPCVHTYIPPTSTLGSRFSSPMHLPMHLHTYIPSRSRPRPRSQPRYDTTLRYSRLPMRIYVGTYRITCRHVYMQRDHGTG